MTQPTLPGMEDAGHFPDEVKRNKPLAIRTVQHDLHYGKPQWTGELHDPDFKESDTPRPGMTGHVPGQMVMGARDLADTGKREMGAPFKNPKYLAHSQTSVTAPPSEKADLEIRPHGGMLDKGNSQHGLIPKYGPQFHGELNQAADLWEQKGESRTIKATTPVSSGQDKLRYDPSSPKRQVWGRQIKGPLENREPFAHDMHNNGLPKVIKFNDELHAVDGHHRLYEARNRGMEDIPVHFLDLDKHNAAQPSAHQGIVPATNYEPHPAGMGGRTLGLHLGDWHDYPVGTEESTSDLRQAHHIEHENIHPANMNHAHEATAAPAAPRGIGSSPQFNRYGQQIWEQSARPYRAPSTEIYRGRTSARLNDDSYMG